MSNLQSIEAALAAAAAARAAGKPIGHDRPSIHAPTTEMIEHRGRRIWAEMIARAAVPVIDPVAETEWLSHRADGLEGCSCGTHWAETMANTPPDYSSPSAYTDWVHTVRGVTDKRIGREPDDRILHALSGGIDSANVLYSLLKSKEQVVVYHIEWPTRRAPRERAAVDKIIAYCTNEFGVTIESRFPKSIILDGVTDIEAAGFVAGGVLREFPRIHRISTSTSATDVASVGWTVRNYRRMAITEIMAGRKIEWVRPNLNTTRAAVIESTPAALLDACSFCRNPTDATGDPCGECQTCGETLDVVANAPKKTPGG